MNATKWWKSKTLWFNAVSLLLLGATAAIDANLAVSPWVVVFIAMGNGFLRLITSSSISK